MRGQCENNSIVKKVVTPPARVNQLIIGRGYWRQEVVPLRDYWHQD